MGYYTNFTLSVSKQDPMQIFSKDELQIISNEIDKMNVFSDGSIEDGPLYANDKWYYYDDDMVLLSSRLPDYVFCLEGEGEALGDKWMSYYHNGMVVSGCLEIVFHPFDKSKLRDLGRPLTDKYYYEQSV